jgi:hypothetical protein
MCIHKSWEDNISKEERGKNQDWQKEIVVHCKGLFKKSQNYCSTSYSRTKYSSWRWFPQKLSDMSFTNPASMVGLQLLNLWLLKVMLRCENDGVTIIKPGYRTTGNIHVIWSDELPFTLFPTSGRVYIWRTPKEAYNPECLVPTVKRRGGSVMVWAAIRGILLVPLLPFMDELLQRCMRTVWVIRRIRWSRCYFWMTEFSKTAMLPFTQLELFSHGLKNMKVNCNIFPGQHNHQIWTSLNHSGQLWRLEWGTDSHLQHLKSNLNMFFKTSIKYY